MEQCPNFLIGNFFQFFLAVIPKLLEIELLSFELFVIQFPPQWFDFNEIRALYSPIFQKLNIFIRKNLSVAHNVW